MSESLGNWLQVGLLGASQTVDRIGVKQREMEAPTHDTHTYVPLHPTPLPLLVSWHPELSSGHSGCGAVVETFTSMAASCMADPRPLSLLLQDPGRCNPLSQVSRFGSSCLAVPECETVDIRHRTTPWTCSLRCQATGERATLVSKSKYPLAGHT